MENPTGLAGLVLAGGRSRRMGTDKALLPVDGVPLVVLAVRFLSGFCSPVLLAGGDPARTMELQRLPALGSVQGVADQQRDAGPLAGLAAGLAAAPDGLVAVLAVDLAAPSRPVLELLARSWHGEPAVLPEVDGRLQPLHAVWWTAAAPALRARLEAGERGVTAAAVALGARVLSAREWREAAPDGGFARNLNDPADLEQGGPHGSGGPRGPGGQARRVPHVQGPPSARGMPAGPGEA